jgi:uncharacterized protein (DUF1499 family)
MKIFSIFLLLIIIALIAARFYFSQQPKKVADINFASLQLPDKPNYCLVYGDDSGKHQRPAVTFDLSKQQLMNKWQAVAANTPRMKLISHTGDSLIYVVHSALFAFPDVVHVHLNSLNTNKTQLWIYSHALYGYSDLGVNCQRVDGWMEILRG